MRDATKQLEHVRRIARAMLLTQSSARWASVLISVALVCAVLDWALRLPGWLRLGIDLFVLILSLAWLMARVYAAARFRPGLSLLALRAERLYPQLSGVLASGVEFANSGSDSQGGSVMKGLMQESIDRAQHGLEGRSLRRLIDPRQTLQWLMLAGVVLAVLGGVVLAAPDASRLAAQRWAFPLGDTQWPRWTQIRNMLEDHAWPVDTPVRFKAHVERGYYTGMRTWVTYRLIEPAGVRGPWHSLLMNEQAEAVQSGVDASDGEIPAQQGVFEKLVDMTEAVSGRQSADELPTVEFYFTAGDDATPPQSLKLVARPAVVSVTAMIQPPMYARGLKEPQNTVLSDQQGRVVVVSALTGSRVDLRVVFNKPIRTPSAGWDSFLPGLNGYSPAMVVLGQGLGSGAGAMGIQQSFTLDHTAQTFVRITDRHGLSNLSERLYRVEAVSDAPPAVSMTQPVADEAVLATAVVDVAAFAQDDVGVESLVLESRVTLGGADGGDTATSQTQIAQVIDPSVRLRVSQALDLQSLGLKTGDQVLLGAVAQDVYELNGDRHDPVRSTLRRLLIIDTATLIGQARAELAGVRQQAIRMRAQQRSLLDEPANRAQSRQEQITDYLKAQAQQIAKLDQRLSRNRLSPEEAGQMYQLLDRAAVLFDQGERVSRSATRGLKLVRDDPGQTAQHRATARADQEKVDASLDELIELLDQGRDVLAVQLQLQQLKAMQEALSADTRRLMPRTLGWSVDQLDKIDRQALKDVSERQEALAKQIEPLLRRMHSTADVLSRQGENPDDQAAAAVMTEAASIAQRQGLASTLKQAGNKASQNRLSDASNDQQAALDVIEQMLEELVQMQERRQVILRRMYVQLIESIRKLIKQQQAQRDLLDAEAIDLVAVEPQAAGLRRRSMVVADRARVAVESGQTADHLDAAVEAQSSAVVALRAAQHHAVRDAQDASLEHLNLALASVEKLHQQADAQEASKKRQELRKQYLRLAQEQQDIRAKTADVADVDQPTRMQRARMIRLGHRQADLKVAAKALRERVQQTLVFSHLHEMIDRAATKVVSRLRAVEADQNVLTQQSMIASTLKRMADALAQDQSSKQFAGARGGGGGGGGSGGGDAPLMPPLAELKLLRGVQEMVYQDTRHLDGQAGDTEPDHMIRTLIELSEQQRELAGLSERLMEQVREQSQQRNPSLIRPQQD